MKKTDWCRLITQLLSTLASRTARTTANYYLAVVGADTADLVTVSATGSLTISVCDSWAAATRDVAAATESMLVLSPRGCDLLNSRHRAVIKSITERPQPTARPPCPPAGQLNGCLLSHCEQCSDWRCNSNFQLYRVFLAGEMQLSDMCVS